MKRVKLFITALLLLYIGQAFAQGDKSTIRELIESREFTFKANTAIPSNISEVSDVLRKMAGAGGTHINISGDMYNFKLSVDTLNCYLPYYGRSYRAPIGKDESGIRFVSTKFTIEKSDRKKGGWQLNITPKDNSDGIKLFLTVSPNGNASLSVLSNSRESISYNGYIKGN